MEELIKAIVTPLVDRPDCIEVKMTEHEGLVTYSLSVDREDVGKVVGKQGRIVKAIRTIVNAAAAYRNKKVYLEIS